ncbi:MAG: response regulator [Rhodospirillaceae bacterium]|nr:response regulator [Rhodospirillaceae bacterium]
MPTPFDRHVILLVDDEASSRIMVGQMLRRMGFAEVVYAEDGLQAIDVLNTRRNISVVLTDFRMPGLHGLQLLKMIRTGQTMAARNLPCALLTSYAERHLVGLAIVLDADTFLAKPVSMETLTKHLARCFQYRFEPLNISSYDVVDVDNAAPHLMGSMFTPPPLATTPQVVPAADLVPPPPPPQDAAPLAAPLEPAQDPKATARKAAKPETVAAPRADAKPAAAPAAAPKSAPGAISGVTSADKPPKKIALADVPDDAIVAKDIIGTGGTLLLAAGTRFKSRYAKRIEELQSIKEKVEFVWIVDD